LARQPKSIFRTLFPPLVNDAAEAEFIADTAAELVGTENVNRNGNLVMASEDFSFMLDRRPGAYIQIGNGDSWGAARSTTRDTISTMMHCRSAPACSPGSLSGNWRRVEPRWEARVVEIKRMLPSISPHPPSLEPVLGPRSARTRGGWVPPLPWYGSGLEF
jgi:hypothetical protein